MENSMNENSMNENSMDASALFDLTGKIAVVTGGTGVLGGAMARGLASAGARVAILGRRAEVARRVADEIVQAGGSAMALPADVLAQESLVDARKRLQAQWGAADILINAAGGNVAAATVVGDVTFFNLSQQALDQVMALNFSGSLLPSQIFGEPMAAQGHGSIINISSMAAQQALTRVIGYSAAKSAIDNLTRWLAVELAQKHGEGLRVNAIAPGFFIGEQNRALLLNDDGSLTQRGQQIVDHTPMGRFGEAEELIGAAIWLASDASRFVSGIVVPVDGGCSA